MAGRLARGLSGLRRDPAATLARLRLELRLRLLSARCRYGRRRVTGTGAAVVNLTSYGHRIDTVFYAIESIARGAVRPRRLLLWLDEADVVADPPPILRRLMERGLEVLWCPDYGPHKKQYAYASTMASAGLPLVAADDDVLYPRLLLADLLAAYARHPEDVHGHRAHRVEFDGARLAPYRRWSACTGTDASYRTLCTGVSGIIYPPAVLAALAAEGEEFTRLAPWADDIWVHSVMVRHGVRGRQVAPWQAEYDAIPGTQRGTLYGRNVRGGGNDAQIAACFGPEELSRMRADEPATTAAGRAAEPGAHVG